MIAVMKTAFIPFVMLWILAGTMSAAQQIASEPAATPLSACELVTKAEVEQAIGTTVDECRPRMTNKKVDNCVFSKGRRDAVALFVSRTNDDRDIDSLFAKTKEKFPHAKIREVPGLGQKAFLVKDRRRSTMLSVYRGGDALVVSVSLTAKGTNPDAAAETIARKAFKHF